MNFFKYKPIDREILRLAVPAITSNITVPLLGICDTAVTGHLGSELYLAAVAAGGTIFNVILWLCGFLRMGTTGLAAEAFGAADKHRICAILWRAILLAMALGSLCVILRNPILSLFIDIISPETQTANLASLYFSICVWGIPPLLVTLSINGWFIGMQNTMVPMIISISMNVLNILASLFAVFALKAGFAGVAYGTLTANWFGMLIAAGFLIFYSKKFKLKPDLQQILHGGGFSKFFRVSSDLFFRSACIMGVSLAVTSIGARMGDLTMAVNTVMLQFFLFFSYFMDGFSFAGEAIVGKNYGAHNLGNMRIAVKRLLLWSAGMAVVFTLIYMIDLNPIVNLLTDVETVRQTIDSMGIFVRILPLIAVWAFIYDGFYIGITATRRMFVTTLCSVLLFAAILVAGNYVGIKPGFGNHLLWTAFLGFLALRGAGLALQLPHIFRNFASQWKKT